jgi:hypothetical protein
MKKFSLIQNFLGYQNKKDVSNTDPRYLITGSHDVLVNDGEKISTRNGYTLDGQNNAALTPMKSSYDWNTSTGTEVNLRSYYDELEYRYVDSNGDATWNRLSNGWGDNVKFRFAEWWSSAEGKDLLLFVNGSSNMYMWTGAITTFASATATTLTKQGSETWAESRFLLAGTRTVVINGVTATYTGGENTTTLTGVSVDFSATPVATLIVQGITTTATTPGSSFSNDIIAVNKNQVYVGDETRRDVFVSKNTSYTDYTFSSPRVPGDGALLTLDSATVGFATQEDAIYITAGKNDWYQVTFTLSSDNTKELMTIQKLKSGTQQAAQSQEMIGKIKNSIVFISNEPTMDTLGRVENINTPQSVPLSNPIKLDFDGYDFTNAHVKYFQNQTFVALPVESKLLIYDHENNYWQPPQTLPVIRLAIIDGELYGHSSAVPETYKLFDTTVQTDDGNPIEHVAVFAYRNLGKRYGKKHFDEYYTEGYIGGSSIISATYKYDFGGFTQILTKDIDASDPDIIFSTSADGSLGKVPLGHSPLGSITDSVSGLPKFRIIHSLAKPAFYEYTVQYSSNEEGYQWELLAHGGNVVESSADAIEIKK